MIIAFAIVFSFTSCDKNEDIIPDPSVDDLILTSKGDIPGTGLSVKIYQYGQDLIVGYNRLEFLVIKNGESGEYTSATITLKPMMDMGSMKHACPLENPVLGLNFNKVYGGAVVFQMPSSDMGIWTLCVIVKDEQTGEEGELVIPVNIITPAEARMKSFTLGDEKIFVSLIEPSRPIVGVNDYEITIHKRQSMMMWPAVETFTVSIDPEMPTMGHGSPNNINPVHIVNGHYKGKVNFTMDGYWKVNMVLGHDGHNQELSFDITFEQKSNK